MPISDQQTVFHHVGNGLTITFPFGCQILQPSDLQVYLNDELTTSGFGVSGIGVPTGGAVTFDIPPADLLQVRIERVIPLERITDYQQNGDFLAKVVNPDFNRIWMALQQHQTMFNRALSTPKSDPAAPALLPPIADRANKLLGFDSNGNPVAVVPAEQSSAAVIAALGGPEGVALVGNAVDKRELAAPTGGDMVNMGNLSQVVLSKTTDGVAQNYSFYGDRETSRVADVFFANHNCTGPAGAGYGFHALDYGDGAAGGGAIGGATSRSALADAIVGNRRDVGDGCGVNGSRWESGNGSGVQGVMRGTGSGHGVYGYKVLTGSGHAVYGRNESTDGAGIYGHRLNNAGPGYGVLGYAEGAGGSAENASIAGIKKAGDSGWAVLADGRGTDAALRAFAANNSAPVSHLLQDVTNTAITAFQFEKQNGKTGVGVQSSVTGGGARTGIVTAIRSIINPGVASTGTPQVYGSDVFIGATITGAVEVFGQNVVVQSTGSTSAYGVVSVVSGANTTNYGVLANATGGTTNWSGYFVGNVFYGGSLTPSDARLKDIHGEVDTARALANVVAGKVYRYDKYSLVTDDMGAQHRGEKILLNEIGPIAQEIQQITPDHVMQAGDYLAMNDRSELYQLKAAVQEMAKQIAALARQDTSVKAV